METAKPMECRYCGTEITLTNASAHKACNKAYARIQAWVKEIGAEAMFAIADEIVARIKEDDPTAKRWVQVVLSCHGCDIPEVADEIATETVMAGIHPDDLPAYQKWNQARRQREREEFDNLRGLKSDYIAEAVEGARRGAR